jgi:hypothetical protein
LLEVKHKRRAQNTDGRKRQATIDCNHKERVYTTWNDVTKSGLGSISNSSAFGAHTLEGSAGKEDGDGPVMGGGSGMGETSKKKLSSRTGLPRPRYHQSLTFRPWFMTKNLLIWKALARELSAGLRPVMCFHSPPFNAFLTLLSPPPPPCHHARPFSIDSQRPPALAHPCSLLAFTRTH